MQKLTDTDMQRLALHLGISARMSQIIGRLFNNDILSYEEIERDCICRSHRHAISRLRPVLAPEGVVIQTHHGSGYWIDATGRENLLRLLKLAGENVGPGAAHGGES